MSNFAVAAKRFGGFMKRNLMYFLIVLCIASVATVIALAVTGNFGAPDATIPASNIDDEPNDPVVKPDDPNDEDPVDPVPEKQTFVSPVNGTVVRDFNDELLVWNATLEEFAVHLGTDFKSDNLAVGAVCAGIVAEIGYDSLDGHYVIINHDNGYQSKYCSLGSEITVKEGAKVTAGQVIGTMSDSMGKESLEGNHLHLEMRKDGVEIDPLSVIILEEK